MIDKQTGCRGQRNGRRMPFPKFQKNNERSEPTTMIPAFSMEL
jgi:hypothetical protein